jgi:hypothetical protein
MGSGSAGDLHPDWANWPANGAWAARQHRKAVLASRSGIGTLFAVSLNKQREKIMKPRPNRPEWISFLLMVGLYGAMVTKALLFPAGL